VQYAVGVVQGAGQGHADAEQGGARAPAQRLGLPHHRVQDGLRPRAQVQRHAPLAHHGPVEIGQHRPQLVAVQVDADGVSGLGDQPQHRARLAAGGRAVARLRGEALLPQPCGDLADGLRGQPGALGEFETADAVRPGRPQQVQHQRGVVAAQGRQVHTGRAAASVRPVHPLILSSACTLATALRKWMP